MMLKPTCPFPPQNGTKVPLTGPAHFHLELFSVGELSPSLPRGFFSKEFLDFKDSSEFQLMAPVPGCQ